jgi:hypothetical protein
MTDSGTLIVESFPIVVIELPKPSYSLQSKISMRVASRKMGGLMYSGPTRLFPARWKHISVFYMLELSKESFYLAQSLSHHPHYSILRSELPAFDEELTAFLKKNGSSQVRRISQHENFQDDYIVVINDFQKFPVIANFLASIDDADLLQSVVTQARVDTNRGNSKLDFGYASGQNLMRGAFGTTVPRILDKSHEPPFLIVQKELSVIIDLVCNLLSLPLYQHRVDDFHTKFCHKLHPEGNIPAWRVATSHSNQVLEVHEDSNNDSRPLMSPVGVFSRLYCTEHGPLRLTKIAYSRKSLFDSTVRESILLPIVQEFLTWENSQPDLLKRTSSKLFDQTPNSAIPGAIEFPCHLERSVGVSPYIHATCELQRMLSLNQHQCIAIIYHCVTSESPFFFYSVFEKTTKASHAQHRLLSNMSPVQLGVWFHDEMQQLITANKDSDLHLVLPRRHQPHNGRVTKTCNIELSIHNLIELCDQFSFLETAEASKQFYHSKAVAIMMKSAQDGGCHACGGLTSQTLLYSLACLGLIPISVCRWGELAGTETAGYLEDQYQLSYSEGRAEQFFLCCVADSEGLSEAQVENRICKWTRHKKQQQRDDARVQDKTILSKFSFRDVIFSGQNLYHPVGGKLCIITRKGERTVQPPASKWPSRRLHQQSEQTVYWEQHTKSTNKRVLGRNRIAKPKTEKIVTLTAKEVVTLLPTRLVLVLQEYNPPLELSLNNLLGVVLGENGPVPKRRIEAEERTRKPGFYFVIRIESTNERLTQAFGDHPYDHARACCSQGALRFALTHNLSATSAFIIDLLHGPKAQIQLRSRADNPNGEYFLLQDNNRRSKGKRTILAIAKKLTSSGSS